MTRKRNLTNSETSPNRLKFSRNLDGNSYLFPFPFPWWTWAWFLDREWKIILPNQTPHLGAGPCVWVLDKGACQRSLLDTCVTCTWAFISFAQVLGCYLDCRISGDIWSVDKEPIAMSEFTTWHASFSDFLLSLRHYTVIGKQLLISNDRNRVRWAVLGLLQDGACTNLFEISPRE